MLQHIRDQIWLKSHFVLWYFAAIFMLVFLTQRRPTWNNKTTV